jgi:hypothetical protein
MLILPEDNGTVDTDAWTMLCMTADRFWDRQSYATLKSASLKCQSIYFIALALHSAARCWFDILVELEKTISDGDAYLSPNILQNSFFVEDGSYSNSKDTSGRFESLLSLSRHRITQSSNGSFTRGSRGAFPRTKARTLSRY